MCEFSNSVKLSLKTKQNKTGGGFKGLDGQDAETIKYKLFVNPHCKL